MSINERDATYPTGVAVPVDAAEDQIRAVAEAAAEAVSLIEHHRNELRNAVAELTALQRDLRNEIRELAAQLAEVHEAVGLPVPTETPSAPRRRFRRR